MTNAKHGGTDHAGLVFVKAWLMLRLGRFWFEHPKIGLSLSDTIKAVDLTSGDIDSAIRFGHYVWTSLSAKKLIGWGYCAIGQPDLLQTLDRPSAKGLLSALWLFGQ